MVQALERVRLEKNVVKNESAFDSAAADSAYAAAFGAYGLAVDRLEPSQAAALVRARSIRAALIAALDDWWLARWRAKGDWQRLAAVARLADDDPWRTRLRDVFARRNLPDLQRLAGDALAADLPANVLEQLGQYLMIAGLSPQAIALLRRAQQEHPGEFWINHSLALTYYHMQPPRFDEAARYWTAALAVRRNAPTYVNLAAALAKQEGPGRLDEALNAVRRAVRLQPDWYEARVHLGNYLLQQKRADEAAVEFREAVRLRPECSTYLCLAGALLSFGAVDEARTALQEGIRLRPDDVETHMLLGLALRSQGNFRQALDTLRRAHQLSTRGPKRPWPIPQLIEETERFLALESQLPDVFRGAKQLDTAERLTFAEVCTRKQFVAAAARLYEEALAADPALTDARRGVRYQAACAAARAGCGQGMDAAKLDATERAHWRGQALAWLRAELATWGQRLRGRDLKGRTETETALRPWRYVTALAGLRGAALDRLPAEERAGWQRLWADVDALLARASSPP
jgi:cytochrome c-type biogenesis protein CcmH/NrfG